MSALTETGVRRSRAWTRQLLENQLLHNYREARELRDQAAVLIKQAELREREADHFEQQLSGEAA